MQLLTDSITASKITGQPVTQELVIAAHHAIEAYIGRSLDSVDNANDKALLATAISWQALHMRNFAEQKIAELPPYQSETVAGLTVTYRKGDYASPYISGFAQMACRGLSWKKARSIRTGRIFGRRLKGSWLTE